ncbi:J domain-containing protein [Leptolyngbya sp. O-77]|uniref:J domain-containing protein n=1 Tax=Leptolyngbya sp. O-77 TaxID=1080068 RepID=UPI00074D365E|nr:J domain-containing protein [Leptolyngbya sp. O-77]BAU41743.1 co-chaperone HscB [Leptolyngbya sp. O-77]
MSQRSFSPDWLTQFTDPYAVLGLSVTADERRVLKRYRAIAKLLHPDSFAQADAANRELATQLFARLVSPTYQKIKQDKGRAEHLALLRFRVRRMSREEPMHPQSAIAQALIKTSLANIDVFYEQAVTDLAAKQYTPLDQFESVTEQLGELNLVYLRLKMGEPIIREKRTGIVSTAAPTPAAFAPAPPTDEEKPAIDYAQRHYQRAQEYVRKNNPGLAVRELKDAIKIDPKKSEYHALLAVAYLMQDLPTMAKVHCRQALKLNPKDPLALRYAPRLNIPLEAPDAPDSKPRTQGGGLFGLFARKR